MIREAMIIYLQGDSQKALFITKLGYNKVTWEWIQNRASFHLICKLAPSQIPNVRHLNPLFTKELLLAVRLIPSFSSI